MGSRNGENAMADKTDWAARLGEADAFHEKRLIEATQNGSAAQRDFARAGLAAYQGMIQDGLVPQRSEYMEIRYTPKQGLIAAVHGRQDSAAILLIQNSILHRLDALRQLAWVAVGLLIYIAIRVTI